MFSLTERCHFSSFGSRKNSGVAAAIKQVGNVSINEKSKISQLAVTTAENKTLETIDCVPKRASILWR